MKKYSKGNSYLETNADHRTHEINEIGGAWPHDGKIHVFGDKKLRNRIIRLLNGKWKSMKSAPKDGRKIMCKFPTMDNQPCHWSDYFEAWIHHGNNFSDATDWQPLKWRPYK